MIVWLFCTKRRDNSACATGLQLFLKSLRGFPGERRVASNFNLSQHVPHSGIDLPKANRPQVAMKRLFALVVCAALRSRRKNRSSGRQSCPCGLKLEGLRPLQATPGLLHLCNSPIGGFKFSCFRNIKCSLHSFHLPAYFLQRAFRIARALSICSGVMMALKRLIPFFWRVLTLI